MSELYRNLWRDPWFNKESFKTTLSSHQMSYLHMPKLGGFRRPQQNSINQGWRNSSFRGYADYMQTLEFNQAIEQLNFTINQHEGNSAIMCAESLPWRCHRSLIVDAELIRDVKVLHIMDLKNIQIHQLTSFAIVDNTKIPPKIYYPAPI